MKELVVISGKGGTGKTTITAALASLGENQVLADCDVDAADLHLILDPKIEEDNDFVSGVLASIDSDACVACGACLDHCRYGAITDDFTIQTEHCEGCGVCAYVCTVEAVRMEPRHCGQWYKSSTRFGPMFHAALGIGEENSGRLVALVRRQARDLAEETGRDFILTDGPPGTGCPVIASLGDANLTLIVTEPTISAVHDLKRIHQVTKHFNIPAMVLINKSDVNPELTEEIQAWCRESSVDIAGVLPYDQGFTMAQLAGQSVCEHDPRGLGAKLNDIWTSIRSRLADA